MLLGVNYCGYRNGDSRFLFNRDTHTSMQSTITPGYAPAIRASRALRTVNVRKMCARAVSLARRKSVTLLCLCAMLSFAGAVIESIALTYSAAFITLGLVNLELSDKKGGAK